MKHKNSRELYAELSGLQELGNSTYKLSKMYGIHQATISSGILAYRRKWKKQIG